MDKDLVDDIYDDDDITWNEAKTDLLSDAQYKHAVFEMCQTLDRVLTGSARLTVSEARYPAGAPAWQDGSKIMLEPEVIRQMVHNPNDEREVLPTIVALNLHEYGHFDFTPRPDNPIWERRKQALGSTSKWRPVFHWLNVVEDQRQEMIVSTRYASARDYFRLHVIKGMHAVHNKYGSIPPENFLLYYGRRHMLPRPLLNRLETDLVAKYGQDKVTEAKTLIDEYMGISATNDAALERMWDIPTRINDMFPQPPESDRPSCLEIGHIGAKVNKTAQDKAIAVGIGILEQSDKMTQNAPTSAKGDMTSSLERALNDQLSRMAGALGQKTEEIRSRIYGTAAVKLARMFEEVSTDLQMTEHNRLRRGKLDIRRIPQNLANNDPRVFHRRQDDLSPRAKMLVHIMVDVSGSMAGKVQIALNACRTIAKACDLTGHKTKISAFASECETLKEWSQDDLGRSHWVGGGTEPLPLLSGALKDFNKASAEYGLQNMVLIVITDGEFMDAWGCATAFYEMHRAKVHTLLIGINAPVSGPGAQFNPMTGMWEPATTSYKCDASIVISDVNQLESKMKAFLRRLQIDLAKEILRRFGL